MPQNSTYLDDFSELPAQAGQRLQKSQNSMMNHSSSPEEMLRLIHELGVHQIELEMQQQELIQSRKQLKKTLDRYTDLYDFAPLGYLTLAPDSKIVEVNLTATKMLNVERSLLRGKRLETFIAAQDRQAFKELLARVFNHKEPSYFETRLCKPGITAVNQKIFRIDAVVNDNREECRAILTDISSQKKIEQTMLLNNERQQLIIDATHCGGWEWNLLTNSFYWSNELWGLYGLDPLSSEATYDAWIESIVPEDRELTKQIVLNATERGHGFIVEWRVRDISGQEHWVMSKGTPFKGSDGLVNRYAGIVIDITELKRAQQIGKNEQAFSKTIIDSINDTFYMIGANGYYAGWNAYLRDEIIGKTESEMAETLAISTIHPDDQRLFHEKMVTVLEQGLEGNVEARLLVHNGPEFRWFLMTGRRIIIDNNLFFIGIGIDITEQKKIEDVQLFLSYSSYSSQNEPFFRALSRYIAKTLEMDFITIDSYNGDGLTATTVALWSNDHFEDNVLYTLNNRSGDSAIGNELCWFPTSELCQRFPHNELLHDLQTEQYASMTLFNHAGKPIGLITAVGKRPVENSKFAEAVLKMVSVRVAGELERQQSERNLLASEKNYRELFERVPIGLYQSTIDGKVITANQNFLDIFRCKISDLESWFEMEMPASCVNPQDSVRFRDILLKQGYLNNFEADFRLMDGRVITISNTAKIVLNKKEESAFIAGSCINITEHKQNLKEKAKLEVQLQQSQKMEMIGRLAGGVAHDFNNMLSVILGHSEFALELFEPSNKVYANLEAIRKAAIRSANLTKQLLAFARKQIVAPKILDLNVAIEEMLPLLQSLIGEHIELIWSHDGKSSQVKIDPSQIDQILVNLCVNARDSISGNGTITLESSSQVFSNIASETDDQRSDYITLSVHDNGCGIDKYHLEHIFEPFFTTKESGKGTGLGLATVYGIIQQNNGTIECQSDMGKGTTFTIRLPLNNDQSKVDQETSSENSIHKGHQTILLVEDEPDILSLCTIILERKEYKVLNAVSAEEAIRSAENYNGTIDLLITDVIMPGINGAELSKTLLSARPELKTLFMSGYTADIIAHNSLLDDEVNFIQKPVTIKSLTTAVYTILNPGQE
jgi:two-component system, cell cycle sensor histidine kinase and response regulator CckA